MAKVKASKTITVNTNTGTQTLDILWTVDDFDGYAVEVQSDEATAGEFAFVDNSAEAYAISGALYDMLISEFRNYPRKIDMRLESANVPVNPPEPMDIEYLKEMREMITDYNGYDPLSSGIVNKLKETLGWQDRKAPNWVAAVKGGE